MIIAGGIAILPSCSNDPAKASIQLNNLDISAEQEKLLAEIAETVIPKTSDAPGARDLKLHLFLLKMVDDCHSAAEQKSFISGLNSINEMAEKEYANAFAGCTQQQRFDLLNTSGKDQQKPQDVLTFLNITKRRVIQGFTNSKFVMTDMKQYDMVPGRYNGYFPVTQQA